MMLISIAILGFLIGNAVVAYRKGSAVLSDARDVTHSVNVIANVNEIDSLMLEAESSHRGYVVTGDDRFLGRYREIHRLVDDDLDKLKTLVVDNPVQRDHVEDLRSLVQLKYQEMDSVLKLYGNEGFETARSRMLEGFGRRYMQDVQRVTSEMADEEDRLLVVRRNRTQESAQSASISLWVGTGIAIVILSFALYSLIRFVASEAESRLAEQQHRIALEEQIRAKGELESERIKLIDELQRSNRELQDFAFVASHDLQEPLRKIQAFGDRLKTKSGDALSDDARGYLNTMLSASVRMQTLISDLLNLSRVTTKAQPFVAVKLDRIASEVKEDLNARIEETRGSVKIGKLGILQADPLQMRQLFQNLLSNALKFSRAGVDPVIEVKRLETGSQVGFTVEDNGIGFDQKHAEKIFTVFQRLHGRGEYEGTGVGLAICRKIVERHQGTIEATSTPGVGTKFTVLFPKGRYEKS